MVPKYSACQADVVILLKESVIEHRIPKHKRRWNREVIQIHRKKCPLRDDENGGSGESAVAGVET